MAATRLDLGPTPPSSLLTGGQAAAAAQGKRGLVNAFPAESRLLWDLLEAGNLGDAGKVYRWFAPLLHLDADPKLVQYVKLAAAECGFGTELTRAPRLPLVGEERDRILQLIRRGIAGRPAPAAVTACPA